MLTDMFLKELEEYINLHIHILSVTLKEEDHFKYNVQESIHIHHSELDDFIDRHREPTIHQLLFAWIDEKGASDTEIYKKAGIDRRHFSKIRSNPSYKPSKNTMIALAFALELNLEMTEEWLNAGGYSLSNSETGDLIIQFCLEKKMFNLDLVNEVLNHYELKTIGT